MQYNKYDLPTQFLERLKRFGQDQFKTIIEGFSQDRATTLRVNTLKTTPEQFETETAEANITLKKSDWYPHAYVLESPELRAIEELPFYTEGHCYVQSFSSMIPPIVLDPKPGEKILDISAAPGSKTTQVAMMMNNQGNILANDSSQIRLYKLEANLKRLGVTNVTVRRGVGQSLWQDYPEYFDKTLVDVPCTMEGRIFLEDPKTYEHWSTSKIKELVGIQRFLLKSAISATKPGGTIVYSTCTLAPEENEGIIEWILKKDTNVRLEDIHINHVPTVSGLASWGDRQYDPTIQKTRRILPTPLFEGFYIAKLKKN